MVQHHICYAPAPAPLPPDALYIITFAVRGIQVYRQACLLSCSVYCHYENSKYKSFDFFLAFHFDLHTSEICAAKSEKPQKQKMQSSSATCWPFGQIGKNSSGWLSGTGKSHDLEFWWPISSLLWSNCTFLYLLPSVVLPHLDLNGIVGSVASSFSFFFSFFFFLCHSFSAFHCCSRSWIYAQLQHITKQTKQRIAVLLLKRGRFDGAGSEPIRRNKEWWLTEL